MGRFSVLLSVVVLLLSSAVIFSRPPAAAQEATPASMAATATHPLAGAWTIVTDLGEDTFPSVAIFHADGTYTEVLPWGQVLLGAWQPTGERTAVMTMIFNYLVDEELVEGQGRATLEVDETGNTLSVESVGVGRFRDGRIDFTDEGFPTTGTRLEAGPMLSLDELIAMTEPPGAATPAAGTPVP
jgi:hypothetical protein